MADSKKPRRPLDEADITKTQPSIPAGGDKDVDDPMAKPGVLPFKPGGLPNEDDEPTRIAPRPNKRKT